MTRFEVSIKLVVTTTQDRKDVAEWAKQVVDMQGDDQIQVKSRTVYVGFPQKP